MKVKNIMFSGFAAAILMGVAAEANAAAKVVASKGYVDSIAGSLDALSTEAKDNLVIAINELNTKKQAKFDDGEGATTTTGFINSVVQTNGTVTASATPFDTEITADDSTNTSTAPTSAAVYAAIQGVSDDIQTYTGGTDIDIGDDNKVNATYESLQYDSGTDTVDSADKLDEGYAVQYVKQVDGKVKIGAKAYVTSIIADEVMAPTTDAVYDALQGKQDTLEGAQLDAVNSGITEAKVTQFEGYATSKQDTLVGDQLDAVNSGITEAKVTQYDGYATSKQNKLTAGKFINIDQNTGTITTTYSAGNNITIDSESGEISTKFPAMPDACTAAGVTCVLTSENGAFVWAILAQPYSYQSGTETNVQRIIDLGYAAQDQKIPEQLYTQQ